MRAQKSNIVSSIGIRTHSKYFYFQPPLDFISEKKCGALSGLRFRFATLFHEFFISSFDI